MVNVSLNINLIVEGEEDEKFLSDFIKYHFNFDKGSFVFIRLEGKDKITHESKIMLFNDNSTSQIDMMSKPSRNNLLVFDSDGTYNNGGFKKRLIELKEIKGKFKINFKEFLFPNHQSDGELEDLLEMIIKPEFHPVLNCYNNYTDCISKINPAYILPDKKGKIYALTETLVGSKEAKGTKRDYFNEEIWDLNHEALHPLKNFLSPYFQVN